MISQYTTRRPAIHTGDAVFFVRRVIRDIGSWADLGGYLSNAAICAAQFRTSGNHDGFHELVHCGVAVRNEAHDELMLAEYTAPSGMRLCRLSERIGEYPAHGVVHLPLLATLSDFIKIHRQNEVERWLQEHREDSYNYTGLLFPEARWFTGWRRPGSMFCSEAVVKFWQSMGVVPRIHRVLRGKRIVTADIEPHHFSPADVARLPVITWGRAAILEA